MKAFLGRVRVIVAHALDAQKGSVFQLCAAVLIAWALIVREFYARLLRIIISELNLLANRIADSLAEDPVLVLFGFVEARIEEEFEPE